MHFATLLIICWTHLTVYGKVNDHIHTAYIMCQSRRSRRENFKLKIFIINIYLSILPFAFTFHLVIRQDRSLGWSAQVPNTYFLFIYHNCDGIVFGSYIKMEYGQLLCSFDYISRNKIIKYWRIKFKMGSDVPVQVKYQRSYITINLIYFLIHYYYAVKMYYIFVQVKQITVFFLEQNLYLIK